jgi:hypothetical protein
MFPHTDKKVTKERDRKSVNLKLAHQGDGGYLEAFVLIVLAWIIFLGYPCKVNQWLAKDYFTLPITWAMAFQSDSKSCSGGKLPLPIGVETNDSKLKAMPIWTVQHQQPLSYLIFLYVHRRY